MAVVSDTLMASFPEVLHDFPLGSFPLNIQAFEEEYDEIRTRPVE